jgi:hypothetical protein
MGTYDLWMGAVSDSDYFTRSGILQEQQSFLLTYDKHNEEITWVKVLDKQGYRVGDAAWRVAGQFVLKPSFGKYDKKFNTFQTVRSAVASDRGGNERAVRLSKLSGYFGNGVKPNVSLDSLADVWLCWSFCCNFMYKPVY